MAVLSTGVIVTLAIIGASIIVSLLLYFLCRSKYPVYDHTCVALLHPDEEKQLQPHKQAHEAQQNGQTPTAQNQNGIQGSRTASRPTKYETKVDVKDGNKFEAKRGSKKETKNSNTKNPNHGSFKETNKEDKKKMEVKTKRSKRTLKPYEVQVEIRNEEPLESRPKEVLRQSSATLPEKCPLSVSEQHRKSALRESIKDKTNRPQNELRDTGSSVRKTKEDQQHSIKGNTLSVKERREKYARSRSDVPKKNNKDEADGGNGHYVHPRSLDLQNGKAVLSKEYYVSPRSMEDNQRSSYYEYPRTTHRDKTDAHYVKPRSFEEERKARSLEERESHYVRPRSMGDEREEIRREGSEKQPHYVAPRSFEKEDIESKDRDSYYVRPRSLGGDEKEERLRNSGQYYASPRSIELAEKTTGESDSYYVRPRSMQDEEQRLRREGQRQSYYVTPRSLELEEKHESYYVSPRSFGQEGKESSGSYYVHPRTLERSKGEEKEKRDKFQVSSQTMRPRSAVRSERDYYTGRPSTSRRPRSAERGERRQDRGLTEKQRSASYYMSPNSLEREEREEREKREIQEWKEIQERERTKQQEKRSEREGREDRDGQDRNGEREKTERRRLQGERERSQERRKATTSRSRERNEENKREETRKGENGRDRRERSVGREGIEGATRSRSRERNEEVRREDKRARDKAEGTVGRDGREGREKGEERRERSEGKYRRQERKEKEIRGGKEESHEKNGKQPSLFRSLSDKRSSDHEEERRKLKGDSSKPINQERQSRPRTRSHSISEYIPSTAERKKRQVHVIHRTKSWASRPSSHHERDDSPPAGPRTIQLEFHPRSGDVTPKDTKSSVSTEPETVKVESQPILAYEVPTYPLIDNGRKTDSRRSSGRDYKSTSSTNSVVNGYDVTDKELKYSHERSQYLTRGPRLQRDGEKTVVSGDLVIEYDMNKGVTSRRDKVDGNTMSRPKSADFLHRPQGIQTMSFDRQPKYHDNKTSNVRQTNQEAVTEKRVMTERVVNLKQVPRGQQERVRPRSSVGSEDVDWHLFTVDGKKVDAKRMRSEPVLQYEAKHYKNGFDWQLYTSSGEQLAKDQRYTVTSRQSPAASRNTSKTNSVTQSPTVSRSNSKRSTEADSESHNESRSKGSVRASLESHLKDNEPPQSRNTRQNIQTGLPANQPVIFSFE